MLGGQNNPTCVLVMGATIRLLTGSDALLSTNSKDQAGWGQGLHVCRCNG